jgi:hypothetical protein
VSSVLVGLGLALAPMKAYAVEGAADADRAAGIRRDQTTGDTTGKPASQTAQKPASQTARKPASRKLTTKGKRSESAKPAPTRRKGSRAARLKTGGELAHTINDSVEITPFPSHAAAARKALAQNRRDQLDDAEKAARDPGQADRWQTVLFHLRGFDSHADAEACFWRVIAYYRLGEIGRARTIRQSCEIAAKDQPVIDKEDVQSASLQPATALPELAAPGDVAPAPIPNPSAYEGDRPTRLDR